jgi:flagellar protein FlbT
MRISLRAGEKFYLNGAVIAPDRKVSLELLNDATFLLEAHVIQLEDARTPLRQLYFVLQLMLMDPANAGAMREQADQMFIALDHAFGENEIVGKLRRVRHAYDARRYFEALKVLRALFAQEDGILAAGAPHINIERMRA